MNLFTKQKQTQRLREQTYASDEVGERDRLRVRDGRIYTALFKMGSQQGSTIQHRELCSVFCGSLDGRGVWGKMNGCVWLSPFAAHLKLSQRCSSITTLLIGYTPIQNKKFKKLEENLNK